MKKNKDLIIWIRIKIITHYVIERVIIFMKKTIFIILIIIISIFVYVTVNAEVIIPNDAIRVRVVPNSNSTVDQNMKEKVKNYVRKPLDVWFSFPVTQ